jgi:7-carboxy-7-deazaguanine synthase
MKVHEIFRSVQGEGFMTGTPMTFIRLYGCNLRCPGCDQPQDSFFELSVEEIVDRVEDEWVCLTGGEPTIHAALPLLTHALYGHGIKVALETNGTKLLPGWCHWVCVSPKMVWPDGDVLVQANEIKLLVGLGEYDPEWATEVCGSTPAHILLQPWWDENDEVNLQEAIRLCQKHQVRLSVQLHKYIGETFLP